MPKWILSLLLLLPRLSSITGTAAVAAVATLPTVTAVAAVTAMAAVAAVARRWARHGAWLNSDLAQRTPTCSNVLQLLFKKFSSAKQITPQFNAQVYNSTANKVS